jgi:hypothetical protein
MIARAGWRFDHAGLYGPIRPILEPEPETDSDVAVGDERAAIREDA